MAAVPESRPDLRAHREAVRVPIVEIATQLVCRIGRKLTASAGGVQEVRAGDRGIRAGELNGDAEQAFEV